LYVWIGNQSERIMGERVLHIAARLLTPELRMRIRTMFLAAAMMIWSSASSVIAQNTSSSAAYLALISTPAGGVPPMAKSWMLADPAIVPGVQAEAIWGHLSGTHEGLDTFTAVASTSFASGAAAVELSFGLLLASCDSLVCGGYFMASSGVDGRVFHAHAGDATVTLGLGGHVGLATPSDAEHWSLWANAPLSVAIGPEGGMQFVPFVSPGLGWGYVDREASSRSGVRFLLGGGVAALNARSGRGVTLSAQKVFIDGGKFVFGAGLTWSKM
jgi:hypothetical protein